VGNEPAELPERERKGRDTREKGDLLFPLLTKREKKLGEGGGGEKTSSCGEENRECVVEAGLVEAKVQGGEKCLSLLRRRRGHSFFLEKKLQKVSDS